MLRKIVLPGILLFSSLPLAGGANAPSAPVKLTTAQIVDKNAQARGGLAAWRVVHTMSMSGKLEAGGKQNSKLPFLLELKRPRKSRFELTFNGQTAVQVYDGTNGWKLRPFLNRRDVEPYTPEESKAAPMQADLDGLLVDYGAKGTKVGLEGTEPVQGHPAYNVKLTLQNGQVRHVWVDADTFLDVKVDGPARRLDGKYHPVATYYSDFRSVDGLMVPFVLETAVAGVKRTEKITIERVVVNPNLQDSHFARPQ